MSCSFDIMVIGGGVIGLTVARELRRLQAGRIAVIERGRAGGEASYAAAGMLAPNAECERIDDLYALCDASRLMYPELAEELQSETGINIELDRRGTLYAAFTEDDETHIDLRHSRQKTAGISVERLEAAETLEAEPCLAPGVRGSLFFPQDWQVENRLLLTALLKYSADHRIDLIQGTSVHSLSVENGHVTGINSDGQRIRAGMTVLATGSWTSLIKLGNAPMPLTVKPIRGQMVSFKPTERLFKRVIYSPRGYLVPRADGRILAGATVEDVGFDNSLTEAGIRELRNAAAEIAPRLMDAEPAESWAGLRPFAADGLPILGPIDGYEGLIVATAHYRNGILLAPATAKLIANRIVNGTDSEYFTRFGPHRFLSNEMNAGV